MTFVGGTVHFHKSQSNSRSPPPPPGGKNDPEQAMGYGDLSTSLCQLGSFGALSNFHHFENLGYFEICPLLPFSTFGNLGHLQTLIILGYFMKVLSRSLAQVN